MFNRPGVTYESAQTRKYQLGRTEVIRSASNETKAWAEAMLNAEETVGRTLLVLLVISHLSRICRTNTARISSVRLSLATSNTPHGLLMAKALIVICSVSRRCSKKASLFRKYTRILHLQGPVTGSSLHHSCRVTISMDGGMAKVCRCLYLFDGDSSTSLKSLQSYLMAMASLTPLAMTTSAGPSRLSNATRSS